MNNVEKAGTMTTKGAGAGSDRRGTTRSKTLKTSTIIYDNGRCTMTCTILEISPSGAKLRPQDPIWVPESFDLKLPDGSRRHCDLVRRVKTDIAVRYAD
jgi:hypothetical protein